MPFIDGKRIPVASAPEKELIDPATGQPWITIAQAGTEEVEEAIQSSQRAFEAGDWRKMTSRDRALRLFKLAELIRKDGEALAQIESRNAGKPIRDARAEVNLAADCFEYYAGALNKVGGQTLPVAARGLSLTLREPIGICGLITPWNFPLVIATWKVAPALAMGNTVILKPASETPLTALRLGELAIEADIPPGVLNILVGSGTIVGNGLVSHPLVRKISFTGSTEVGVGIMKLAAASIKRVTLELGGKSANLVFADADWAKAIDGALWSVLGNAGQDCCARSRLLVERAIYEPFVSELAQRFQSVRLGLPRDEATEMGPLISASHRETVRQYINIGLQEGATLKQGGEIPTNPELSPGFYLQPTLFTDVHPGGRIAQEEIFGPVLAVIPFETEAEALAIANNSLYGLSGSIWTKDLSRALRVAQAMETGVISINSSNSVHLEAPFGGVKQSGIGRELGLQALDHYSEQKTVFIATED